MRKSDTTNMSDLHNCFLGTNSNFEFDTMFDLRNMQKKAVRNKLQNLASIGLSNSKKGRNSNKRPGVIGRACLGVWDFNLV